MTRTPTKPTHDEAHEGFLEIDGEGFYLIPDVDRLQPFLMSIVSGGDQWMFISSHGGLTAGRRNAASALFPYETDDRLHNASGLTGSVTAIRHVEHGAEALWQPLLGVLPLGARRNLYKSVVGNQVIFEEIYPEQGLVFRSRWSNSDRFGFVRTATIVNIGERATTLRIVDGLVNLLPFGLEPPLYQRMSNLTNAYKRSEVVDPQTRLAVFSLESHVVDRPEPAEALVASIAWSGGLDEATVSVNRDTLEFFRSGGGARPDALVTGRPGSYLLSSTIEIQPGEARTWRIVADVGQDQVRVAALRRFLRTSPDPGDAVAASVREGTEALVALMARSDALQRTGDRAATAHHFANVTYNVMRGGVFPEDRDVRVEDFSAFLSTRNRVVADRHAVRLRDLPELVDRAELLEAAEAADDAQLHAAHPGVSAAHLLPPPRRPQPAVEHILDPRPRRRRVTRSSTTRATGETSSRTGKRFVWLPRLSARRRRPSSSTPRPPDGFNPYRITRDGIDWEVPDPDDPWSNIGYWGDHQIVYLLRLLEATVATSPAPSRHARPARFSLRRRSLPHRALRGDAAGSRRRRSTTTMRLPIGSRRASTEIGGRRQAAVAVPTVRSITSTCSRSCSCRRCPSCRISCPEAASG